MGAFPRAILNIHPALLPAFGGKGFFGQRVHEEVIRSGARWAAGVAVDSSEEFVLLRLTGPPPPPPLIHSGVAIPHLVF